MRRRSLSACPLCASERASGPDALAVRRCLDCGVEFRPPVRVPVRVSVREPVPVVAPTTNEQSKWAPWVLVSILLAAGVALVRDPPPPAPRYPQIEIPRYRPPPPRVYEPPPRIYEPPPIDIPELQLRPGSGRGVLDEDRLKEFDPHREATKRLIEARKKARAKAKAKAPPKPEPEATPPLQ